MTLDVDQYLSRGFDIKRYNCWHMTRDAWMELTGEDLGDLTPAELTRRALLQRFEEGERRFRRLDGPVDPCLVLMRQAGAVPHVGVYLRGRVLQLLASGGAFLPLAVSVLGYQTVSFHR